MNTAVATITPSVPSKTGKHLNNPKAKAEAKKALDGEILQGFSYDQLDPAVRTKVRKTAQAIHANLRRMEKDFVDNGRKLLAVKDDLGHGHFGPWLLTEFHWSVRTAQNYMAVAERLADDYQHVAYLPSQTIYALAAKNTPEKIVAKVIDAAKADKHMTAEQVEAAIARAKPTMKLALAASNTPAKAGDDGQPSEEMQEADIRGQKMHDAVALLVEKLEDDFSRFVDLMDGVNFLEFKDALFHARAEAMKAAA